MSIATTSQPATQSLAAERYRLNSEAKTLTPALIIHRDLVAANIATTIRLVGGTASRWRPHVKTAKLSYVMRMLVAAGVRQFKCATGLELRTACEAGAEDVVVAYPLVGANAARVRQIAGKFPQVAVSVLVENEAQIESWRGGPLGVFVDVNPGMNRTGVPQSNINDILRLCRAIADAGLRFRGLHYYDGHLSKYELNERFAVANQGYDRLLEIVAALDAEKLRVEEVTTAGTPAMPCSLAYAGFRDAGFIHRVSPGTVVYCDTTSSTQLPAEYEYAPAAVVMTRVVSHPAAGIITCDAGHKSVSADAGIPTCAVIGHSELEPMSPSEEHLPMRVTGLAPPPPIGEVLYLVPRHVCPTVNNFDHAVIAEQGSVLGVEAVTARGREAPLAWAADHFLP